LSAQVRDRLKGVAEVGIRGADRERRHEAAGSLKRDGRWQIVAAHMAFVLDPQQAEMLSGEHA
jgi:hypothetical protein